MQKGDPPSNLGASQRTRAGARLRSGADRVSEPILPDSDG